MKNGGLWCAVGLVGVLVSAGCKNNNLFGGLHREGSGDSQSLVADGQAALTNSEYAKANNYFTQALEKDPSNSDALYGQAVAQMGMSGMNMGQLIANLTQGNGGSPAPGLAGAIRQSTLGFSAISVSNPNSLLYGIDSAALDEALKVVILDLEKIHMGLSDGKIPPNDASLLINLGLARMLKGAAGPLRANVVDVQETAGTYTATVTPSSLPGGCPVVVNAIYNVAWGFLNLSEAAVKLNLVSGSTLSDITADVDALYDQYKGQVMSDCPTVPSSRSAAGVPSSPSDRLDP